jgi:hypothetical protein|tara:strand:+ start:1168 stop:1407 length:240 start_codon:yes stop_codon:yes gene_type:complete
VPTAVLEIVDLGDGEIVLRRSGEDSEPLVRVEFSEETREYLMDNSLEVARAMFQAGLQAAAVLLEQEDDTMAERPRVLH